LRQRNTDIDETQASLLKMDWEFFCGLPHELQLAIQE
jgi:hypothetical protein